MTSNPPVVLVRERIEPVLFDLGVDFNRCNLVMADDRYVLPARDWFVGTFAHSLRQLMDGLNFRYLEGAQDCDDFARFAAAYAQLLLGNTMDRPAGAGLAVAEFWFQSRAGGHAIVAALVHDLEGFGLVFMEPQDGSEVTLSAGEVESCSYMRF